MFLNKLLMDTKIVFRKQLSTGYKNIVFKSYFL